MPPSQLRPMGGKIQKNPSGNTLAELQPQPQNTQPSFDVIGNIGFPSSRNKGELISPSFTEDEFTQIPAVAQL